METRKFLLLLICLSLVPPLLIGDEGAVPCKALDSYIINNESNCGPELESSSVSAKDCTGRIVDAPSEEKRIKGIVIYGGGARWVHPNQGFSEADGIKVMDGVDLPGSPEKLRKALNRFIGCPMNSETICEVKKRLVHYYRQQGRPIVDVSVPEQNVTSGVLRLLVHEATLGKVVSSGNRHFSSKRLVGYVRGREGEPIDADRLVTDLNWMNRNTFRQTDAFFTPGNERGTTDIELLTKDRRTWRVYVGTDNTGLEQTGEERNFVGFNLGNFLALDQQFTFQFTMGNRFNEFSAYTAQWVIPLPWRNMLTFYGGYSTVHTSNLDIPFNPGFGTHGHSMQASMRWDVPLPPRIDFLNEFIWGADWKRTNNTVSFIGTDFFGKNANLFQIVAGYNLGYEDAKRKVSLTWENFFSPGDWLPDQSVATYNSLRAFAKPLYYYTRLSSSTIFREPKHGASLAVILRGQWSTANLLASEEFGIGGYDTVRGYDERQFNGDYAFVANVEARTPQWPFFLYKKRIDKIQFLGFFDYGRIWLHEPFVGEPKTVFIDSIGVGARYIIDQYLTARIDYGYGLKKIDFGPHTKIHFSVIVSY